jgi:uncharacterized OB-fold protein
VEEYFDLPDTGTVQTYTISNVDWASAPLPEGRQDLFAVIAVDGASPEMGLVHRLGDVDPGDIEIGMRVKAVWKPAEDREGSVTDILHFRPLGDGEPIGIPRPVKPLELTSATTGSFPGRIPLDYAYTAGLGGNRFYAALAEGRVVGTRCDICDVVLVPPAAFCEEGMHGLDPQAAEVTLEPDSGYLAAATRVFEDRAGRQLDAPVWVIQVAFAGASGAIFGRLDTDRTAVPIGLPVEVVATEEVGPEHVRFRLKGH